ncbi:MAG: hypothetical protein ABI867_43710 [Kofleriaceae bacterium]
MKVPFPFFGQGDAHYYEWFELWIWFVEPVAKGRRASVIRDAPAPCRRDAQWPDQALLWASTGDQWIHQHMIEAYGTKSAKAKFARAVERQADADADDDDDYLDDLIAGPEEKKFNTEIERWLRALHARHPILFVARREDGEAGGTKLGAWHRDSVKVFAARVLPALEALAKTKVKATDLRRSPISIVLDYVGKTAKIPRAVTALRAKD